jgi:hypothetical protein
MSTAIQRTRALAVGRAASQPAPRPARRPPLEVVAPRQRRARRSLAPIISGLLVSASLLMVVIGHAMLAQGQVRLATIQAEITAARLRHQREGLAVASLESPSRIFSVAEGTLHMEPPGQVHQLPDVPLGVPLPPPHLRASAGSAPARPATPGG